jgi:hypothetical protein
MEYKCGAPVDESVVLEALSGTPDMLAKYKERMVQSVSAVLLVWVVPSCYIGYSLSR